MQVVKQIITVPPSRELRIQLPAEAAAHEEAEVIVLFKSWQAGSTDKIAAMREAATDPLYLADLKEAAAAWPGCGVGVKSEAPGVKL